MKVNINRQLAGLEDLLFGVGTVTQDRQGTNVTVTKINAANLPFDETQTLAEAITDVQPLVDSVPELLTIYANLAEILQTDDIYDLFDDRFLGAKAVDPLVDNDGDPLQEGAIYWNTALVPPRFRAYSSTEGWQDALTLSTNGEATLTNKFLDDITNYIGANHIHYPVRNGSDFTLAEGTVITAHASQPGTDYLVIEPMGEHSYDVALGVLHQPLAPNATGLCTNTGMVADSVDTSEWNEGDILYAITADYADLTTTTSDYSAGEFIFNTELGQMYECILNSTTGTLLTNATYFKATWFTATKPTTGKYQACAVVTRSHATQGTIIAEFTEPTYVGSTTQAGYVQLVDDLVTDDNTKALTAAQGKVLEDTKVTKDINGVVSENLTFSGTVVFSGESVEVNPQTVTTSDNIIVINEGEVGAGVTNGTAGFQVDRGSLDDYYFLFDESDDAFKVGENGSLQAVATREDIPTDAGIAVWDAATSKFITTKSPTVDSIHSTGAITTDSTVDGRDVAADGAKLDAILAGAVGRITQPLSSLDLQNGFDFKGTGSVTYDQPSDLNYTDRYGNWKTAPASGTGAFGEYGLVNAVGSTNLLTYSEDFQKWTLSEAVILPDVATAVDKSYTMDKVVPSIVSTTHAVRQVVSGGLTSGNTVTLSLFVKAAEYDSIKLNIFGGAFSVNPAASFNLTSETVGDVVGLIDDYSIVSHGGGVYRVSITATPDATSTATIQLQPTLSDFSPTYAGDGSSGIYIWGAQLEESTFPTPYIPSDVTFTSRGTTGTYYDATGTLQTAAIDVARMSYNPADLTAPPKLLVEEERTNRVLYSEDIDTTHAEWSIFVATCVGSSAVAPDGASTASLLTTTADGSSFVAQSLTKNVNTNTFSVFVKQGTGANIAVFELSYTGTSTDRYDFKFDFTTESFTVVDGDFATYQKLPNGWYRISITSTDTLANTSIRLRVGLDNLTGDTLYIWGAQFEEASYATSYTPTTTAAVTRLADITTSASATRLPMNIYYPAYGNVPDLTKGATYLVEFVPEFTATGIARYIMSMYTDNANAFGVYVNSTGNIVVRYEVGNTVYTGTFTITDISGQLVKLALRTSSGLVEAFKDGILLGSLVVPTTLPTIDATSTVSIGSFSPTVSTADLPAQFTSDKWYPKALTDEEILLVHGA